MRNSGCGLLLVCAAWSLTGLGSIREDRYYGYLALDQGTEKFAATLDIVTSRPAMTQESAVPVTLHAVLRANRGGFDSTEYVANYYEVPNFRMDQSSVRLEAGTGNGPDLSFPDLRISADGLWLRGGFSSLLGGNIEGRVVFVHESHPDLKTAPGGVVPLCELPVMPEVPDLAPVLTGSYEGKCGATRYLMQFEVTRSDGWSPRVGTSSFAGYQIHGRRGIWDELNRRYVIERFLDQVGANFWTGTVSVPGLDGVGVLVGDEFVVDSRCRFQRIEQTSFLSSIMGGNEEPRRAPAPGLEVEGPGLDIKALRQGAIQPTENRRFFGYLFLESRGAHEFIDLVVRADQSHRVVDVAISVDGCRDVRSDSIVAFRYRTDRSEVEESVLSGADDSFVRIEAWDEDFVRGTLYSRTAGRVGPFVATTLPSVARAWHGQVTSQSLSGFYQLPKWQIPEGGAMKKSVLEVRLVKENVPNHSPSYFPFRVSGELVDKYLYRDDSLPLPYETELKLETEIASAQFDPFSGAVLLMLQSNDHRMRMVGRMIKSGLYMYRSPDESRRGRIMNPSMRAMPYFRDFYYVEDRPAKARRSVQP